MATPFVNQQFTFHDPDGTPIEVRGTGSQFGAVFETLDGFVVVPNPESRFYEYADVSEDGASLVPSGHRVHVADPAAVGLARHVRAGRGTGFQQSAAAATQVVESRWETRLRDREAAERRFPQSGPSFHLPPPIVVGLCIPVRFPDDVAPGFTRDQIANFCNQVGYSEFGNNGSVFDYFAAVSENRLSYTNVVVDYYTAAHPRAYYTDPGIEFIQRARELATEGLQHLTSTGFDFAGLSADEDGFVWALNVFYTGDVTNNFKEGLWPHQNSVGVYDTGQGLAFFDYQVTAMGAELTLGTFCHENGHMVCSYPDLYNRVDLNNHGVGGFCLMGNSESFTGFATNPVQVCGYLKDKVGWTTRITEVNSAKIHQVQAGVNDFLIHRKSSTEYFLIENRQQTGRDAALPDGGLAIWHVDRLGSNDTTTMSSELHYEASLEQADGTFDLERGEDYGDAFDLWGFSSEEFSNETTPDSKWWDGTASGLEIVHISDPGPTMEIRTPGSAELTLRAFGYDQGDWRLDRHVRLLADVSGQGRADIVGFDDDGVWVSRSLGEGRFTEPTHVLSDMGQEAGGWRVDKHLRMVADIAGNTTAGDLIGFGYDGVLIYPNLGNGSFGEVNRAISEFGYDAPGEWRIDRHPRFVHDITGNGKVDVIGFGHDGVKFALNNGDGTFGDIQVPVNDFCYDQGWRVDRHPRFIADIAGNGHADLVGFFDDGVYFYPNKGNHDASYGARQKATDEFGYDSGWRVDKHPRFLAPLRKGGPLDIIGFFDDGVRAAFNNGDGTFARSRLVSRTFGFDAGHWRVDRHPRFVADLTGDGAADIIGFGSRGALVARNRGDGSFDDPRIVVPNFGSSAGNWQVDKHIRALADLSGKGRLDIVGFGFDGVIVSRNNGRGRF